MVVHDEERFDTVRDMVGLLDLEELDRDLYRGRHAASELPRTTLFGGQVAAQALRAAATTVPEGRFPHSLHGYFLRPGRLDRPVILRVDRDRDGRSFSARHVAAVQEGEVIFSMLASFHGDEPFAELADPPPDDVPDPETLPGVRFDLTTELRPVWTRPLQPHDPDPVPHRMWTRITAPLPDDRLLHACALTYLSDIGNGFGLLDRPDLPRGGPTIDHALWFQEPVRADDWLLLDLWPAKARSGRGLYQGAVHDRHGRLAALLSQESLLRAGPRPDATRPRPDARGAG